jgi:hypothetical protein
LNGRRSMPPMVSCLECARRTPRFEFFSSWVNMTTQPYPTPTRKTAHALWAAGRLKGNALQRSGLRVRLRNGKQIADIDGTHTDLIYRHQQVGGTLAPVNHIHRLRLELSSAFGVHRPRRLIALPVHTRPKPRPWLRLKR